MGDSDASVKLEDDGLSVCSKKINKRDKSQVRFKSKKKDDEEFLASVDPKYIPDEFYDPKLSAGARKKMLIKIRNRAAAQTSRDKKKAYVNQLEDAKNQIIQENKQLKEENRELTSGWGKMEEEIHMLRNELQAYKMREQEMTCMHCGRKQVEEENLMPNYNNNTSTENSSGGLESPLSSPLLTRCSPKGGSNKGFYFFMFAFAAIVMTVFTLQVYGGAQTGLVPSFDLPKIATNLLMTDSSSNSAQDEKEKDLLSTKINLSDESTDDDPANYQISMDKYTKASVPAYRKNFWNTKYGRKYISKTTNKDKKKSSFSLFGMI